MVSVSMADGNLACFLHTKWMQTKPLFMERDGTLNIPWINSSWISTYLSQGEIDILGNIRLQACATLMMSTTQSEKAVETCAAHNTHIPYESSTSRKSSVRSGQSGYCWRSCTFYNCKSTRRRCLPNLKTRTFAAKWDAQHRHGD